MHKEFRENYNEHIPKMNNGGFQTISMNLETNFAESPALSYWKKLMKYKINCQQIAYLRTPNELSIDVLFNKFNT